VEIWKNLFFTEFYKVISLKYDRPKTMLHKFKTKSNLYNHAKYNHAIYGNAVLLQAKAGNSQYTYGDLIVSSTHRI